MTNLPPFYPRKDGPEEEAVRRANAIERGFTFSSGLIPGYNPEDRCQVIAGTTDQELLKQVALHEDEPESVRIAAINAISNEAINLPDIHGALLRIALMGVSYAPGMPRTDGAGVAAAERLSDQESLRMIARSGKFERVRCAAVRKVDDRELLTKLATDKRPVVQAAARRRLAALES